MTSDNPKSNQPPAVRSVGEEYRNRTKLRAAVQVIPYIGGPIDTLLSGNASRRQEERFISFLENLNERLQRVEVLQEIEETDQFYDLMLDMFDRVIRTRSQEKREGFAQIIVGQVQGNRDWDAAEEAARLLGDLSDIHVEVLREALAAQPCGPPFEGLRVISLAVDDEAGENVIKPVQLNDVLPIYSHLALRMACAELAARGLLHDEGIGRWDLGALQYLVPTDLASWFVEQIALDA